MEEKELVQQVIKGSEVAFRALIAKYERLVLHMVSRVVVNAMDREELCQDVFIKIHEKIHTFHFESKLSTWIATIAYRLAVNFVKRKRINEVDLEKVSFKVDHMSPPTEEKDMKNFIHGLIDQLPVNYKVVLTLFYLDGFSYPEIVDITGMPEGTVKNYIHRARIKLKKIVEDIMEKEIALV